MTTLGIFIATIDVYGVMSYSVCLRAREIGIRMAVGQTGRTDLDGSTSTRPPRRNGNTDRRWRFPVAGSHAEHFALSNQTNGRSKLPFRFAGRFDSRYPSLLHPITARRFGRSYLRLASRMTIKLRQG